MKKWKTNILSIVCLFAVFASVFVIHTPASQRINVNSEGLTLNTDVLKRAKNETYGNMGFGLWVTGAELFSGINEHGCTLADILNSLEKYGYPCSPGGTKDSYGILMHNLYFGTYSWWDDSIESYQNTFSQKQRETVVYPNTEFEVYFLCELYDESGEIETVISLEETQALINKVEFVNKAITITPHTQKNGWLFENEAWHYYENGTAVSDNWKDIEGKRYYFKDDGSMVHSCLYEKAGKLYSFSTDGSIDLGWQIRNPGDGNHWYYFAYDPENWGAALMGLNDKIEGDNYNYFFWTNEYTDQYGNIHAAGSLAIGTDSSDQWIFKNGIPVYVADKDGHLYTNIEKEWNGIVYIVNDYGNVSRKNSYLKPYGYNEKNYSGKKYDEFLVVSGFEPEYVTEQTIKGDFGNCTATCDFLVGKITGQLDKNATYEQEQNKLWGNSGATWLYTNPIAGGSKGWSSDRKLKETYLRIEQGIPVILRCSNHSVTAIGIRKGTNRYSVTVADILVVDSSRPGGKVISLADLAAPKDNGGCYLFNKNGAEEWGLRIAKTADSKALTQ